MYKFVILDIGTNNVFLVFFKYRPSYYDFNKLVTKSKNTCKNKKKDYFYGFFNMLKRANIIYF